MIKQTSTRMTKAPQGAYCKKTECLICFQSGNPNYVNHRIKDNTGKVVCPTLLNQKCHICNQTGHTPKYCVVSKLKKTLQKQKQYSTPTKRMIQSCGNDYQTETVDTLECMGGYEETKEEMEWSTANRMPNSWASIAAVPSPMKQLTLILPTEEEDDMYNATTPLSPPTKKQRLEAIIPITKKKPRPQLWSQYESDEEYE